MHRTQRNEGSNDNSHFGKAFSESATLLDAQQRLNGELSSSTRTRLNRKTREATAELKELEARNRSMTLVLAAYCRQHDGKSDIEGRIIKWVPDVAVEIGSCSEFDKWCGDKFNELDKLKERRLLTPAEDLLYSALEELADLDVRAIWYRLQTQYAAHGKRGRPKKSR